MYFLKLKMIQLNQAELNEIKVNDDHEIFEVPAKNDKPRRRTLNWH